MNMEVARMEHEVCLWLMTAHVRIIVTQTKWKGRLILQKSSNFTQPKDYSDFCHPVRGKQKFLKY